MIVNIEDRSIQELLQVCVKEEVEFLARNLLRKPKIRKILWPFVTEQIVIAAAAAGLNSGASDALVDEITLELKTVKPPSGGGGGSDPGDDGGSKTGGGGNEDKDGSWTAGGTDPASIQPAKKKTAG